MIKKILVRDYLKGYDEMTAEERRAFVGRVGEWLTSDGARLLTMTDRPMAKSQNLVTISTRWTAEDTKAVADGIMLMSALVGVADTWLPTQIYMRSAYRAIRQVVSVLSEVSSFKFQVSILQQAEGERLRPTTKSQNAPPEPERANRRHSPLPLSRKETQRIRRPQRRLVRELPASMGRSAP